MTGNNLKYVNDCLKEILKPWYSVYTKYLPKDRNGCYRSLSISKTQYESNRYLLTIVHYKTCIMKIGVEYNYRTYNDLDYPYFKFDANQYIEGGFYGVWLNATSRTDATIINTVFNFIEDCTKHYTLAKGLKG